MATPNIQLTLPPFNSTEWNQPLNANFTIIDGVFGGTANVAITGTQTNLKIADTQNLRINLSGNQGPSNSTVVFPSGVGGSWIVSNNVATTGGKMFAAVSGGTIPAVEIPNSASVLLFSDRNNIYAVGVAGGGAGGDYLPLTGGTITGDLGVNKSLTVGGVASLNDNVTLKKDLKVEGQTELLNLKVTGAFNIASTNLAVPTLSVNNAPITGNQKLSVAGISNLNGDVDIGGNLKLSTGGITVSGSSAANSIAGATTIPSGGSLTVKSGATFRVEDGAQLALAGTFRPTAVSTGDIDSTSRIRVTGAGGVDAGSGGLTTSGVVNASAMKVSGAAELLGATTVRGVMSFTAGVGFYDNVAVQGSGWANIKFYPYGQTGGTVNDTGSEIGFLNRTLTQKAVMNTVTGKWTASGGVGIGISGPVAQTLAAWCPAAVYREENEKCSIEAVDLEDVLVKLVEEIASLKADLAAVKRG